LRRYPGLAAHGERKDVDLRHGAMIENPLADGDLPLRVGIDQKLVAAKNEQRVGKDANPQRQQPARKACVVSRVGNRQGHGRRVLGILEFSDRSNHALHNSR